MAHPTGCDYDVWPYTGARATCSNNNGGSYRAIAVCTHPDTGKVRWFYGNWLQHGTSYAYCEGSYWPTSAGVSLSPRNET